MDNDELLAVLRSDIAGVNQRVDDARSHLSQRIDDTQAQLSQRIEDTNQKIDDTRVQLSQRIDDTQAQLSQRIEDNSQKIDDTRAQLSQRIEDTNQKIDDTRVQLSERIEDNSQRIGRVENGMTQVESRLAEGFEHMYDHMHTGHLELGRRIDAVQTALLTVNQLRLQGLSLVVALAATVAVVGSFALQLLGLL